MNPPAGSSSTGWLKSLFGHHHGGGKTFKRWLGLVMILIIATTMFFYTPGLSLVPGTARTQVYEGVEVTHTPIEHELAPLIAPGHNKDDIKVFVEPFTAEDVVEEIEVAAPPPENKVPRPLLRPEGKPIPHGRREIDISSEALPMEATLEERLESWRFSPGGRGEVEGEVEVGGFTQWNLEQCENVWPNHNKDLIAKATNTWAVLNRSSIHEHRERLIMHLEKKEKEGAMKKWGSGRGIVFTAGNADTLQRVVYTLRMLRHRYDSNLPAQIYHFSDEKPNPENPLLAELKELNAEMVEAVGSTKDKSRTKNYHLKAIAIVQCPWREVLYLDSDNIPTRDPEYLFDAPNYKRLGAIFWPDYWKTNPSNPIWAILGIKCRNEWEMEAGQIIIDKKLHLDTMILSQYMLEDFHFWFYFSDGDKDIFRFAFLGLRKRWGVPGRYVGVGGLPSGTQSGEFCGLTMQQYDHMGEPAFIHYNLLKQVPSGVGRGFSWGRTKQFPMFTGEATNPNVTEPGFIGNVDCDHLADSDDDGHARSPASEEIRKRAALERGARAFFHGGYTSALCIDMRHDDPRPDSSRDADAKAKEEYFAQVKADRAAQGLETTDDDVNWDDSQLSSLGIKWGENMLEVAQWRDDVHLKDFENQIYDEGFIPSGHGF